MVLEEIKNLNDLFERPAFSVPLHGNLKEKIGDRFSTTDATYLIEVSEGEIEVRPAQGHGMVTFIDQFTGFTPQDNEMLLQFLRQHIVRPDLSDLTEGELSEFGAGVPRHLTGIVGAATRDHYDEYDGEPTVRYIE